MVPRLSNAPKIILECKNSWIEKNPDWEVRLIDKNTIDSYKEIKKIKKLFNNLSIAHISDLIRLALLERNGGVWVDASLFCIVPLKNWIFEYLDTGFFLFESDTNLTIIANWFIASERNHITIKRLKEKLILYWSNNNFGKLNKLKKIIRKIITPIFNYNKLTSRLWLSPLVLKTFKIYPYQIFYFLFENIIRKEPTHKEIWDKTLKLNKYICWPYQDPFEKPTKSLKLRINEQFVPMLKFKWRGNETKNFEENSLVFYLKNIK